MKYPKIFQSMGRGDCVTFVNHLSAVVVITVFLFGCSGKLYTITNDISKEGVVAYPPTRVIELYKTTVLTDKDGKVIGIEGQGCTKKAVVKITTRPDFSSPYRLAYDPGIFENNTFSVELDNGMLKSINASSDVASGITAITGTLSAILPFIAAPKPVPTISSVESSPEKPLCNTQEILVGFYAAPKTKSFDELMRDAQQLP